MGVFMKLGDKIIIVFFIFSIFVTYIFLPKASKDLVRVKVDGKVVYETNFPKDTVITKRIESEYGFNIIEIGADYVKVVDASCKNKLDVKQGKITSANQSIICLPNRMIVEIIGSEDKLDAVVH